MANTFTLKSNSYDGRYLQLTCSQTQDITNNQSTIRWTLSSIGGNSSYYSTGPTHVYINGEEVYSKARVSYGERAFPASLGSTSGTLIVKHDSQGKKTVSVSLSTAIYTATVNTYSNTWALDSIPRAATITSAPNFTDEENPIITYSNVLGNSVSKIEAYIHGINGETYVGPKTIDVLGTSAEITLTNEERSLIRSITIEEGAGSLPVGFSLRTTIGTNTYWSDSVSKTVTIVNATPEIHSTVYDVNEDTVAATGDSEVFIKYCSSAQFQVEATPKKGASITGYNTVCGSKSSTLQQSTFYNIDVDTITFTATDNRGIPGSYDYELTLLDYFKPSITQEVSMEILEETEAGINAKLKGSFCNTNFGAKNNEVKLFYRLAEDEGEFGEWIEFTEAPSINGNDYTLNTQITGLDYQKTYTVQCSVSDLFYSAEAMGYTLNLIPVFDWSKNDFSFNVPVNIMGYRMNDFVVEHGTSSMGSNGTWYWRKWNSGRAECYGCRNYGNMAVSTPWGSMYESASFSQTLPSNLFKDDAEYIDIEIVQSGGAAWVVQGWGTVTATSTGAFCIVSPTPVNLSQVWLGFNVIGNWK